MSYAAWERRHFHRPLAARAWSAISAKARAIRAEWRRRLAAPRIAIRDCGECPMNGSSFCPCDNQPMKGTP